MPIKHYKFSKYNFNLTVLISLGIMVFCSISMILWGADKSLGSGDEGVYILSARYPGEFQQSVSATYIYTGFLFRMVSYDLVMFRLLGVFLVILSALWFWIGFYKLLVKLCPETKMIKYIRALSCLFILLGALLLYEWFYLTPNYNTLNSIGLSLFTGSFFWGLSLLENWKEKRKLIIYFFILSGLGIGFAIFNKFPSGICFSGLCFLAIFLWQPLKRNQKLIISSSVLAGIIIWISCYFLFVQSPKTWWQMFNQGWQLFQAYGKHAPKNKSFVYITDTIYFLYRAVKIYWPCYLLLTASFAYFISKEKLPGFGTKALSYIIGGTIIIAIALSLKSGIYISERNIKGTIPFYLLFHLAWILLLLALSIFSAWYHTRYANTHFLKGISVNTIIILIVLIGLPIAAAFGTSNPVYNLPLCHAATWFGAILLLLVLFVTKNNAAPWLLALSIISIGLFSTSQITQGFIFNPQQILADLFHQTEPTTVGFPEKTLLLDIRTHTLVKELSTIAQTNGFKPGDDIIAISYIPGIVYAIGGRSPGHPVFILGDEGAFNYSRLALKFADTERLKHAFVLLNIGSKEAESLLTTRGIDFPNNYDSLGSVASNLNKNKKFSLWKPKIITK
ncbi:MAG: hypothetical protein H0W84_02475 [Bacteroidetes bacterium]|nr:hypothetical protein [Bacteroidota bacterium]